MKIRLSDFIKKLLTTLGLIAVFLVSALPARAQTVTWSGVCVGTTENSLDVATIQGLECLIANVFTVIITIIGLSAFIILNLIASFTGISIITQFRIPEADSGL